MKETLWTPRGEIPISEILAKKEGSGVIYKDKKPATISPEQILAHLSKARRLWEEQQVGQREATVEVRPAYPDLPIFIWLLNDVHAGSVFTDYQALIRDYQLVRDTANFYVITNGDQVDNFLVDTVQAAGVYEDAISPEQQALLVRSLLKELDSRQKLLGISFGNHEDFIQRGGLSFEGTWLRDLSCPIFNCGGLLILKYGGQEYKIALTHRFWGFSKLNPTNACKRFMEHAYPDADVIYLAHSHQREYLYFERGGKGRVAIVGGTYKVDDEFGQKRGIGVGGQMGGLVLGLSGKKREMRVFESVPTAREYFEILLDLRKITS
ncbi:MAG: metallophosphoesterase [Microgenomates group bacterium]